MQFKTAADFSYSLIALLGKVNFKSELLGRCKKEAIGLQRGNGWGGQGLLSLALLITHIEGRGFRIKEGTPHFACSAFTSSLPDVSYLAGHWLWVNRKF